MKPTYDHGCRQFTLKYAPDTHRIPVLHQTILYMLYNGFPDQEKYEYSGYYEEWGRSLRSANEFQIKSYDNHATLQEMSDCTMDDWKAGEPTILHQTDTGRNHNQSIDFCTGNPHAPRMERGAQPQVHSRPTQDGVLVLKSQIAYRSLRHREP